MLIFKCLSIVLFYELIVIVIKAKITFINNQPSKLFSTTYLESVVLLTHGSCYNTYTFLYSDIINERPITHLLSLSTHYNVFGLPFKVLTLSCVVMNISIFLVTIYTQKQNPFHDKNEFFISNIVTFILTLLLTYVGRIIAIVNFVVREFIFLQYHSLIWNTEGFTKALNNIFQSKLFFLDPITKI